MYIAIFIILIIFIVALGAVWTWYVKNETAQEPDSFEAGGEAFRKKNFKKAETFLSKYLAANQNSKEARELLGQTYLELGNYDKAKECFDKLLKAAPKDPQILLNMAKVLEKQNAYDQAKDFYKIALQENPQDISVRNNIALVNYKQGNYEEAKEIFEKSLKDNPDNIEASFYLIKCESELCDFENSEHAEALIEKLLKLSKEPNLPKEFDVSLALAYAKTGQIDKTLAASQRALETDSENVEAYKILGLTQLIKKDLNSAKSALTTGLHLDPSNQELHELLSYVLCQQKNRCALKECRDKYMEVISKFINKNKLNEV